MTTSGPARRNTRKDKSGLASWFSGLPGKKQKQAAKTVTIRVERSVKRRVLKLGKKGRKHASEAFESDKVSGRDIEITREVMQGIAGGPAKPVPVTAPPPGPVHEPETFTCVQCGARMPSGAERCPTCDSHYLNGISDEQLRDLEEAEGAAQNETLPDSVRMIERSKAPCIHFSAESGTVSYLQVDDDAPDISLECGHCGTEIEFDAERCPICGSKLENPRIGLAGLFAGMEFDDIGSEEMDCPVCGERVTVLDGKCPACQETIKPNGTEDSCEKIDPVIHTENVVFLHLDVSTGEVNFLQRLARNQGFEQATVQLDGIGTAGFDKDWKGLSRV